MVAFFLTSSLGEVAIYIIHVFQLCWIWLRSQEMFCSHEDFKPCKTEHALLLNCFIVAYGWRSGWLFWASNVDFCCWAFFSTSNSVVQTHVIFDSDTFTHQKRTQIQRSTGFRWGWFSTGFIMCAFFSPELVEPLVVFTKKITGGFLCLPMWIAAAKWTWRKWVRWRYPVTPGRKGWIFGDGFSGGIP